MRRSPRFRGIEQPSEFTPEDWIGSATTLFGKQEAGLTRLPDGRLLRDALVQDPEGWLGEAHLETLRRLARACS